MPFSFRKTALELGTSVITNTISNAILGKSGRGGSSDFADLNNLSGAVSDKLGMKTLRYPLDVDAALGMGNQGHYIIFFINEQTRSELKVGSKGAGMNAGRQPMYGSTNIKTGLATSTSQYNVNPNNSKTYGLENENPNIEGYNLKQALGTEDEFSNTSNLNRAPAGAGESTVFVKRRATKRLNTAISMYMPTGVKATYGAKYEDSAIGAGARFAADLYSDVMAGKDAAGSILDTLEKDFPQAVREAAILAALKLAENVPGFQGATDVLGMATGEVVAERLELAFRNINKRKFQYTFKMLPKSREEADMVFEIVKAFKKHMSASFKEGNRSGKTLIVPDTFNIEYMYNGGKNQYLHQISECVLETVDVSYGGDRYKTFAAVEGKGAPPVETTMSLNFAELELISRERVEEGF